jgi:hypothetical protein
VKTTDFYPASIGGPSIVAEYRGPPAAGRDEHRFGNPDGSLRDVAPVFWTRGFGFFSWFAASVQRSSAARFERNRDGAGSHITWYLIRVKTGTLGELDKWMASQRCRMRNLRWET